MVLGPYNMRVMLLKPWHAEDGGEVADTGNVKAYGFLVRANLEMNGAGFMRDETSRAGATVHDF
jgi:hypothetical protein